MKFFSVLILVFYFPKFLFSQSVGIGTTTPNSSAILDVNSTAKGLLLPRMTTTQRNAIVSPVVGLQIFNTEDKCTDIYDGTYWIKNCGFKQTGVVADPLHTTTNSWVQMSNFNGVGLLDGVGFSIGNKGYVGTGYVAVNTFTKEFWEYDQVANVWTQKADFGGSARYDAFGFAIDGLGYIGTGRDVNGLTSDFWMYDPITNTWIQKANFGGGVRDGSVAFNIGSKGYAGTGGNNSGFQNDFWEYNPVTNIWTQKANFGGSIRTRGTGFSIGSKGYIGPGYYFGFAPIDFWEYDPVTNLWTQKANFPNGTRESASCFTLGNAGYICSGLGPSNVLKKDLWKYSPANNTWTQMLDLPGLARRNAFSFSIGNKGYLGTGFGSSGAQLNDFWEYMDDNSIGGNYTTNVINTTNNQITDGAWTLSSNNAYNANTGNIGIGTNAPANKLSVLGNTDINGFLGIMNNNPQTELDLQGMLRLRTSILPVAVGQNSLNLKDTRSTVYVLSCQDPNGCNLASFTYGIEGRIVTLVNKGPYLVNILHESAVGNPVQRIQTGTGSNATIKEGGSITFRYDGELTRWTILNSSNTDGLGLQWKPNSNHIYNANTGNIGIGTINPTSAKLHVRSSVIESNTNTHVLQLAGQNPVQFFNNATGGTVGYIKGISNLTQTPQFSRNGLEIGTAGGDIYLTSLGYIPALMINGITNNVGIGTNTPSHKLAVNGSIRCKEVIVESANWPDYVFAEKYKLKPLSEVEAFIKKYKHLPDINPASDVQSDGLKLGEMQNKMMEKIEELTLYIIELSKQNEAMKNEIDQLKSSKK